jgi:oligopeptide/dipeptide ABC transporter ATP-binding protein
MIAAARCGVVEYLPKRLSRTGKADQEGGSRLTSSAGMTSGPGHAETNARTGPGGAAAPGAAPGEPLLELDGLTVWLEVDGAKRAVLREVSLAVRPGEALGLVGESGSGKSMTARAIGRLLPQGADVAGAIRFRGRDVGGLAGADLRQYRNQVAMIFQDPRAHINPVRRVGDYMTEALRANFAVPAARARQRAVDMLGQVGIADGEARLRQYPHQLSGGILQRVMIAAALLPEPSLLLADEPTTALDVTTQAEVMAILDDLRHRLGLAMVFITHDLELAAAICDRTAVMYAGQIVEVNISSRLHDDPLHPYTAALAAARPDIAQKAARLQAIPGRPLSAFEAPAEECAFAPRCAHARALCTATAPWLAQLGEGLSQCLLATELRGKLGKTANA